MNRFTGLSATEGRREHFRLLREEAKALHERSRTEPIFEEVNCPLGCLEQAEPLLVKDGSSFVRCPGCGLIYVNPQLTESALAEHFASSPAWEVWARSVLPSPEQQAFDIEKYRSAIEIMKELYPDSQSLLDIGANSGFFLSLAREAGFKVSGIEPSEAACKVAKELFGLALFNGQLADYPIEENSFDIITFWASLEYHKYPKVAISKAVELLRPEGLLLIFISGNAHSLVMRMLREKCVGFLFNRLWYFSLESLDRLVSQVNPALSLAERYSVIPSLDVIAHYLSYEDPYSESPQQLFSEDELDLLQNIIEKKNMGYKFLSIYRRQS